MFSIYYRSYPTMLELAVEATYPICEALVVALISVSSSVQGVTIMELDHYLATPISNNKTFTNVVSCRIFYKISIKYSIFLYFRFINDYLALFLSLHQVTCHGEMPVVDHTYYLYVSNSYVIIWSLVFIFFFQTKFHRTAANKHEDVDVSTIVHGMK